NIGRPAYELPRLDPRPVAFWRKRDTPDGAPPGPSGGGRRHPFSRAWRSAGVLRLRRERFASRLTLSQKTIRNHVSNIFTRFRVGQGSGVACQGNQIEGLRREDQVGLDCDQYE